MKEIKETALTYFILFCFAAALCGLFVGVVAILKNF